MNDPIELLERPDRPASPDAGFEARLRSLISSPRSEQPGSERRGPQEGNLDRRGADDKGSAPLILDLEPVQPADRRPTLVAAVLLLVVAIGAAAIAATQTSTRPADDVQTPATSPTATSLPATSLPATSAPTKSPNTAPALGDPPPGWTLTTVDHTQQEGAAYAASDEWLFTWGGASAEGALVDLASGETIELPEAPIAARQSASAVWTGSQFVVFGGHSPSDHGGTNTLLDGAMLDPTTGVWRPIAPAPLDPWTWTAAAWDGEGLVVWVSNLDDIYHLFAGPGQMARYDPVAETWTDLPSPPPAFSAPHVELLVMDDQIVLVGGARMRDLGGAVSSNDTFITTLEPDSGGWTEPVVGPRTEAARAFVMPDGRIGLLTAELELHAFDGSEFELTHTLDPHGCWWDLATATTPGVAYLKVCGSVHLLDSAGELTEILGVDDPGRTGNTWDSGFVTTPDGHLIVMDDVKPTLSDPFGYVFVGTYSPDQDS